MPDLCSLFSGLGLADSIAHQLGGVKGRHLRRRFEYLQRESPGQASQVWDRRDLFAWQRRRRLIASDGGNPGASWTRDIRRGAARCL